MIALAVIAAWFGSGWLGSHLANRRLVSLFGADGFCEPCALITIFAGPIGLLGAAVYLGAMSDPETPEAEIVRGEKL